MSEFLLCENFVKEAQCALNEDPRLEGTVVSFPARCGRPPLSLEEVQALAGGASAVLLGGCCVAGLCMDGGRDKGRDSACVIKAGSLALRVCRFASCFEMVAEPSMVDRLSREGRYLATVGWLACWGERLAEMGLDRDTARDLFRESATGITLLDTGCDDNSRLQLAALGKYLQMPWEVIPVGRKKFRSLLQP